MQKKINGNIRVLKLRNSFSNSARPSSGGYPNNNFENEILYSIQVTNYECMELSMYNLFVW